MARQKRERDQAFASVMYNLSAGDPGYAQGRRVLLEDRSEQHHLFATKDLAIKFAATHGLYLVTKEEMDKIREQYSNHGDK
jgi:hypothetical protein